MSANRVSRSPCLPVSLSVFIPSRLASVRRSDHNSGRSRATAFAYRISDRLAAAWASAHRGNDAYRCGNSIVCAWEQPWCGPCRKCLGYNYFGESNSLRSRAQHRQEREFLLVFYILSVRCTSSGVNTTAFYGHKWLPSAGDWQLAA
jgi:hypothetical protein